MRSTPAVEGIDFNKLWTIIRANWIWIAAIFIATNLAAYLALRYSKNVYESVSEIKLDVKSEASEFGIKNIVEDQPVSMISGEIEMIQSKLFLNRVLDHTQKLDVSFISVGRVLFEELFISAPASVRVLNKNHNLYNTPIYFHETDETSYVLSVGENGKEITGRYGERIMLDGLELILSRNAFYTKGDELGYYFTINDREVLLNYLRANLSVEPLNYEANTIQIAFKDYNARKAQFVLNKIDSVYLEYSNEQKNQANKQKIDWVNNELRRIESRMEDYENYFEQFMLQNKTNDLEKDFETTIRVINKLDSQSYELTRRLKETEALRYSLSNNDYTIPVSVRSLVPSILNEDFNRLAELRLQHEKLKLSHSEITFSYREKERELQSLKNQIVSQIENIQSDWRRKLNELNNQKAVLQRDFAAFPDKNTEFSKNQRFYKLYEEFYLSLMQSKSEFEIAQAGTIPDFKILSPASYPNTPISPHRWTITGIGIVSGFVLNFFLIGILYLINNKITSVNELERFEHIAVLGSVPASRYQSESGLHLLDHPKSMVSEAMRTLRTNLDFFSTPSRQKVVAISSTVSGEGKSFIAMNLGGVIALSRKKVLLIDLDMRKAKGAKPKMSVDETKGVSTVLIKKHKWSDCIIQTPIENFHFIPAGPNPPNPSELLSNGEFTDLIKDLKQSYDFIILDTPPVGLVTDGIMAMRQADISIYVFRANYSKREFLSNLQRITTLNKFSHITTILNAVPVGVQKTYGYGYYEENGRVARSRSTVEA